MPADWASRMLERARAAPEAVAIGGSVENGATDLAADWASFLVVQTVMASPNRERSGAEDRRRRKRVVQA